MYCLCVGLHRDLLFYGNAAAGLIGKHPVNANTLTQPLCQYFLCFRVNYRNFKEELPLLITKILINIHPPHASAENRKLKVQNPRQILCRLNRYGKL